MNILITGGTGFIGSHLCHYLKDSKRETAQQETIGHNIWVLSRDPQKVKSICGENITGVATLKDLDEQNIAIDAVINLVGAPIADERWTTERKNELLNSRIASTQRLVEWIKQRSQPVKVLISGSAIGYYGECGNTLVGEDFQDIHEDFASKLCRQWEEAAYQAQSPQTRVVCLRTAIVLSSKGGMLGKIWPIFKLGLGGKLGNGKQWFSWIHLTDVMRVIDFLMTTPEACGSFNMSAPDPVTNEEFTKALGKALSRPTFFAVPQFALSLRLGEELANFILASLRANPKKLTALGFQFKYPDIESALNDICKNS
ncbi:MAG: TIGR01777 family oxidoreductase [Saezia sp.]